MREIIKELVKSANDLPAILKFSILVIIINNLTFLAIIYLITR